MKYKTIILLDDNETALFYNRDVVAELDKTTTIVAFSNADSFLDEYVKNLNGGDQRNLLLLDVNMPQKKGFEIIEDLEERLNDLDDLDIIVVTSSNLKIDYERATRFPNIIGFIEKPLTVDKLKKAVNGIF